MFWIVLLFAQSAATSQVDRGQALFLDPAKGCASCHALKGKGTAVGPDLTGIGRLPAGAIATAVRSTVTQYVQQVKTKGGESFAAMPSKPDDKTSFFDLSKMPPQLRTLEKADIKEVTPNDGWKHPPAAAKIPASDLADVIAFIRFAATGSRQAVNPDDIQE